MIIPTRLRKTRRGLDSERNSGSSYSYRYKGKTYWFRKENIHAWDRTLKKLKQNNVIVSGILLMQPSITDPQYFETTDQPDTPIITMKNLRVLTDYIRTNYGDNIHVTLDEQGYSSTWKGQNVSAQQSEAVALSYYLAMADPMVDSFIILFSGRPERTDKRRCLLRDLEGVKEEVPV